MTSGPRTGIPDHFRDEDEYEQLVDLLVTGGAAKDASYLCGDSSCTALSHARTAHLYAASRVETPRYCGLVPLPGELAGSADPITRRLVTLYSAAHRRESLRAKRSGPMPNFFRLTGARRDLQGGSREAASSTSRRTRIGCNARTRCYEWLAIRGRHQRHAQLKLYRQIRDQGGSRAKACSRCRTG